MYEIESSCFWKCISLKVMKRKKKRKRYYVHPIDVYDPGRDKELIKDEKWGKIIVGGYLLLLFIIIWFTPVFEIITDLFKYGLFKNIDGI